MRQPLFPDDLMGIRDYFRAEEDFGFVVEFLDESNYSGWDFLLSLVRGEECESLVLSHPFLIDLT